MRKFQKFLIHTFYMKIIRNYRNDQKLKKKITSSDIIRNQWWGRKPPESFQQGAAQQRSLARGEELGQPHKKPYQHWYRLLYA
jgi:hypothetical protein